MQRSSRWTTNYLRAISRSVFDSRREKNYLGDGDGTSGKFYEENFALPDSPRLEMMGDMMVVMMVEMMVVMMVISVVLVVIINREQHFIWTTLLCTC